MRSRLEKIQWGDVLRNKRDRKHCHPGSRLDRRDKQKSLEKPRVEVGAADRSTRLSLPLPPTKGGEATPGTRFRSRACQHRQGTDRLAAPPQKREGPGGQGSRVSRGIRRKT